MSVAVAGTTHTRPIGFVVRVIAFGPGVLYHEWQTGGRRLPALTPGVEPED